MTAPAKTARTKSRKPALRIVGAGPNLEEMERVLTEAAAQQAPMINRASAARQKAEAAVKALEGELDGVRARRELARRHHEALDRSFQAEEDDINRAIGIHTGGLTQDVLTGADRQAAE